jgi:hypothetical protein
MIPTKLYVSVTRDDGSFLLRGMASEKKTREVLSEFAAARPGGRAVFTLLSQHDGRMRLRAASPGPFEAEVIGRAAHAPALWGLLPAKPEIALRRMDFTEDDAQSVVHALYTYGRAQFLHLVKQERAAT